MTNGNFLPLPKFASIPQDFLESPAFSQVSGNGIKIYCALRSFSNGQYKPCWPSLNTLAKRSNLSINTLKRCLKELEEVKLIRVQAKGKAHRYYFLFDYDKNSPPVTFDRDEGFEITQKSLERNYPVSHLGTASPQSKMMKSPSNLVGEVNFSPQILPPNQIQGTTIKTTTTTQTKEREPIFEANDEWLSSIKYLIQDIGLALEQIKQWQNAYSLTPEYWLNLLKWVKQNCATIKNPAGFIHKALKENWQFPKQDAPKILDAQGLRKHQRLMIERFRQFYPVPFTQFWQKWAKNARQSGTGESDAPNQKGELECYFLACQFMQKAPHPALEQLRVE